MKHQMHQISRELCFVHSLVGSYQFPLRQTFSDKVTVIVCITATNSCSWCKSFEKLTPICFAGATIALHCQICVGGPICAFVQYIPSHSCLMHQRFHLFLGSLEAPQTGWTYGCDGDPDLPFCLTWVQPTVPGVKTKRGLWKKILKICITFLVFFSYFSSSNCCNLIRAKMMTNHVFTVHCESV